MIPIFAAYSGLIEEGSEARRPGRAVPHTLMNYTTILVHVDDTPGADERCGAAARLAGDAQAHLIGVAATGVTAFLRDVVATKFSSPAIVPYLDTLRQRASHALEGLDRVAAGCGEPDTERRQTDDDPFEAISALMELARASGAELLVMGCYGHPRACELLLGGTARSVMMSASLPVLMSA